MIPQQPLKFNIKEFYTFYSLHFHKGTVDKHVFKKAETKAGFGVNNKEIKCKLCQLHFLYKVTVILSFLKDVSGELSIPIEMQEMKNCILGDLHKTTCVLAVSKDCCHK